jgi:hypothetical protein
MTPNIETPVYRKLIVSPSALAGNIVVDRIGNRAIAIRQESVMVGEDQMVRFTADVRIAGFTAIFR